MPSSKPIVRTFYDGELPPGDTPPPGGDGGTGDGGSAPTLPEGAFTADKWRDALPEELREHSALAKAPNVEALARSYISGQKLLGKTPDQLMEVPDHIDTENRLPLLQRLGLPEEAGSDYNLQPVKHAPEYLKPDTDFAKAFTAKAHSLGIFPDQVQGLYNFFADTFAGQEKEQETIFQQQIEANEAALKAELGEKYDTTLNLATLGAAELGIREEIENAGLGVNPKVIKALAKVGELFAEDGTAGDITSGGDVYKGGMSPDELRAKARELQQEALDTDNHAKRRKLNDEAQKYYSRANAAS